MSAQKRRRRAAVNERLGHKTSRVPLAKTARPKATAATKLAKTAQKVK